MLVCRHGHGRLKVQSYWRKDVDRLLRRHRGKGVTVSGLQAKRTLGGAQLEQAVKDDQARAVFRPAYTEHRC